jgi:hypothetical protein
MILAAVPGWVEREVARITAAWLAVGPTPLRDDQGRDKPVPDTRAGAAEAGRRAAATLAPTLGALLAADVDDQSVTPLQLVRELVRFPTAVLAAAGIPPVERDTFRAERFPDDPYDMTPASLAALDTALGEVALTWGAAKAMAHRRRHRPPGVH